ncbi:MAG: response regulator [Gammaproteobacteria bacterium]|nr:MAG: response regulator [Gammaproteobacteria bacterium]RKZ72030.1 MAG: response regulator [Gammaproteobacteria bacterium]
MKKVLYVDDSEVMRKIVKMVLENLGYQILTASSGKEAVEVCSKEQPDLVLMDLSMPNFDGFATIQVLINNGYTNPIVILTASENEEDRAKAKALGCADYILKTVDMGDIKRVINRHIV